MLFLVHTQRKAVGIHFVYTVNAPRQDAAFDYLRIARAIDKDEMHVETLEAIPADRSHELIAIVKSKMTIQ